ncbi:MAG: zinc-ribbon domain-containing protein, partial [Gemmataceae bacterium]|nr:zinc-ribbon domain-containing protein [Gemmataceae bacterium]
MAVNVTCPACGAAPAVGEDLIGRKLRCKACSEVFVAATAKAKAVAGASGGSDSDVPVAKGKPLTNGVHKDV